LPPLGSIPPISKKECENAIVKNDLTREDGSRRPFKTVTTYGWKRPYYQSLGMKRIFKEDRKELSE